MLPDSLPIGAPAIIQLSATARFNQDPVIYSITQGREIAPDRSLYQVGEIEATLISLSFNNVPSSLSGENVVCFSTFVPDSRRRRKQVPLEGFRMCGEGFNLTITGKNPPFLLCAFIIIPTPHPQGHTWSWEGGGGRQSPFNS